MRSKITGTLFLPVVILQTSGFVILSGHRCECQRTDHFYGFFMISIIELLNSEIQYIVCTLHWQRTRGSKCVIYNGYFLIHLCSNCCLWLVMVTTVIILLLKGCCMLYCAATLLYIIWKYGQKIGRIKLYYDHADVFIITILWCGLIILPLTNNDWMTSFPYCCECHVMSLYY